MKSTIKVLAIVAVLAGFLAISPTASAHTRRHHRHHRNVVYVTSGYGYGSPYYGYNRPLYYNTGYGYGSGYGSCNSPYYGSSYSPYYGSNYYGRSYYRRPAISFSFGF